MQNRVVEISSEGVHLSLSRGFLSVKINDETAGQVAIDDMSALIIRGYGASLSVNICSRLAEANVPVVICGSNQAPASVIWPINGHYAQGLHMQAQASANAPLLKRLWAQVIKAKVLTQAHALEFQGRNSADLRSMIPRIKTGDKENIEAQAARRYWPRLMGDDFKRDRAADGINAALNYGYTILRSASARSILAAGLHPSLSIQHQSRGDALRLADDLMEPFRPWVDLYVCRLIRDLETDKELDLTSENKALLASVLSLDLQGPQGNSPLQTCIDRLAQSLVQIFMGECKKLELPGPPLHLSLYREM
jgi:CRISPR-associated protein Cas1